MPAETPRAIRGRRNHAAGLAAEAAAARIYERAGGRILARRWRCAEGEIDLVVALDGVLVFVEVKSGRFAAEAIGSRQWARLEAAALRYSIMHETGSTPLRFDAALVAADGAVEVVENARGI